MRRLCAIFSLLLVTGCGSSMEKLHKLAPEANDFDGALAAEYLAYADSEKDQGHMDKAEYFAGKGVSAAEGHVDPENVSSVPATVQKSLKQARDRLMVLMVDDMKKVAGQKLARAQLLFDCWVDQSQKPGEEIAPCAGEFESTIEDLQLVAESFIQGQETIQYIQFSGKSTLLTEPSMQTIADIASKMSAVPMYSVTLDANPSGTVLSARRLTVIKNALVKNGLPEKHIRLLGKPTTKAVYLSGEEPEEHPNAVKVTTKVFDQAGAK